MAGKKNRRSIMKKITLFMGIFLSFLMITFSATALRAETAKKFNLSIGGYFGIGGATEWDDRNEDDQPGAFALGIEPELQFFPIDKLAVNFRGPIWERLFYAYDVPHREDFEAPMDVFPFIFGVRYYFPVHRIVKMFVGGGIGFSILQVHLPGWYTDYTGVETDPEVRASIDFNGGAEFEVINHLALTAMFDIMVPNLGPVDKHEDPLARFMFFFGVSYYIPLKG